MKTLRIGIAIAVAVLVAGRVGAATIAAAPGDHYLCYKAKAARATRGAPPFPKFAPRSGDSVVDALVAAAVGDQHLRDLRKPLAFCSPADKNGEGVIDAATHLEAYKSTRTKTSPRQPAALSAVHEIDDQFGTVRIKIRGDGRVLVPSAKAIGSGGVPTPAPHAVDTFACYPTKPAREADGVPAFTPRTVVVEDQFGTLTLELVKPTRVCAPANFNGAEAAAPNHVGHLLCYRARLARTPVPQPRFTKTVVSAHNAFGPEVLTMTAIEELCVPGIKDPPRATSTPLTIASATPATPADGRTATPGRSPSFTPARTISPTRTPTPTRTATISPTRTVTPPKTATPPRTATPLATRTATVLATPTLSPTPTATLTGPPTLSATSTVTQTVPATLTATPPPTATRTPGPTVTPPPPRTATPTATATPIYTGATGTPTRSATPPPTVTATPIVTFTPKPTKSATPTVTRSPTPTRSATPTPTRSATPTRSPTPVGTPQKLQVQPATKTVQQDASTNFTAVAVYRNGVTQNYTQKVTWSSSNATIATVSNEVGSRGRATGHEPGSVTISVEEPLTGLKSSAQDSATLKVLGALQSITLTPGTATRNVNETVNFSATGFYEGGTEQNLTQKVIYSSDNLNVAFPPNLEGNRSLIEAVGVGTAVITATDPDTGITSKASGGDAVLTVE